MKVHWQVTDLNIRLNSIKNTVRARIEEEREKSTTEPMQAFAGSVRRPPEYIRSIINLLGKIDTLHFAEVKSPVGLEEAAQLLRLKTTRGGPEQLVSLQKTITSLLGVSVDAFAAEEELTTPTARPPRSARRGMRPAEMDIDNFLIEANGAGIREALRIILDLELKKPGIALIEEPEVHLPPGLEKVIHGYLVAKSVTLQVFLATHSTSFLDVSSRQSVYIVSRSANRALVEHAVSDTDILRIPGDIGLRPSTVFMFDRLVFVEGPTDEAVFRALASVCEIDLASKNVGFVKMGGASNTSYFASEATLDLLSKRQIPMTFVLDRDEREDEEINKIKARLGDRGAFHVLQSREIENYLAVPEAILQLLTSKQETSVNNSQPTLPAVREALRECANGLKERSIELTIVRKLMKPIFLDRASGNGLKQKMESALSQLNARISALADEEAKIRGHVNDSWDHCCLQRCPGSELLDAVFKQFGFSYQKERDAVRLAKFIPAADVPQELRSLLQSF